MKYLIGSEAVKVYLRDGKLAVSEKEKRGELTYDVVCSSDIKNKTDVFGDEKHINISEQTYNFLK